MAFPCVNFIGQKWTAMLLKFWCIAWFLFPMADSLGLFAKKTTAFVGSSWAIPQKGTLLIFYFAGQLIGSARLTS